MNDRDYLTVFTSPLMDLIYFVIMLHRASM